MPEKIMFHFECIGSLDEIGYKHHTILDNYLELTSRIIFVNGNIVDYEKSINKKHNECLLQNPVPDNARACSELDDAQKCLFKESDNNWAYRYECAMIIKIFEISKNLINAEKWCTKFAEPRELEDKLKSGVKDEELVSKIISNNIHADCKKELHANGLIFENGINNYVFLNIEFNYHTFYIEYLEKRKSNGKTLRRMNRISSNDNAVSSLTLETKREEEDNKILNAKEWCAENAKSTGTFITNKNTFMNAIPDIQRYNIDTTLVNICNAVLQTKLTITKEGAIVKKNNYLDEYKKLMSKDYVYEVTQGILLQWCEDEIRTNVVNIE